MANEVTILGESGTLSIVARPWTIGAPEMEFSQGSFRGSVDERRVIGVFLAVPSLAQEFELRFEFTDPGYATVDLNGNPLQIEKLAGVLPYTEPKATRDPAEGR